MVQVHFTKLNMEKKKQKKEKNSVCCLPITIRKFARNAITVNLQLTSHSIIKKIGKKSSIRRNKGREILLTLSIRKKSEWTKVHSFILCVPIANLKFTLHSITVFYLFFILRTFHKFTVDNLLIQAVRLKLVVNRSCKSYKLLCRHFPYIDFMF